MKATGVVRKVDHLGRIVLPKELRRNWGINEGDGMEIFVDGEFILLKKYTPACLFCHSMTDIIQHEGKNVCTKCVGEIAKKMLQVNPISS
ncbi:AbrB/MazE/SpoVT family DNA-binding domain-containing protein [Aneurinibacillus thermoaerophilus]|uniref:AbrB/MazE/SpoVT family DNA-binding domain-containing protein n=1 Tax=Aneurinibacillus thermoaerophilus TaxID=143495 RepID=UPI002E1AA400|nr:AbrB/MazE/SpoVT family DNA-binding domain-containing protein [Aneurinibacillus thermoaerophilus]MED0676183.1 AbrB/MazE/SpoVT family DNA-binding domain-containing protein [Aneurinibacillus thermoaerophilus]